MKIETTGIVFRGQCGIRTSKCTALNSGAVTAVWEIPSRQQINVCSSCLSEMIREGKWNVPAAEFKSRADIVVKNQSGDVVFVIEVKNNDELNNAISAEKTYAELLRKHSIPASSYFLLVAPKKSYLWINKDKKRVALSPSYTIDNNMLFPRSEKSDAGFGGYKHSEVLKKQILFHLLSKMKRANHEALSNEPNDWLIGSGLFDEIKNGTIQEDFINKA